MKVTVYHSESQNRDILIPALNQYHLQNAIDKTRRRIDAGLADQRDRDTLAALEAEKTKREGQPTPDEEGL